MRNVYSNAAAAEPQRSEVGLAAEAKERRRDVSGAPSLLRPLRTGPPHHDADRTGRRGCLEPTQQTSGGPKEASRRGSQSCQLRKHVGAELRVQMMRIGIQPVERQVNFFQALEKKH